MLPVGLGGQSGVLNCFLATNLAPKEAITYVYGGGRRERICLILNPGAKGTNYIRNLCIASPHGTIGLLYLCVLVPI